ncbi:ribonuclease E/G [Tranquillimonas rosea]|uniref:ribonuclease E/G n=1 Tax=Tranquillimonas rosea TaxID=641238 RepID=UPI003BAB747E
MKGRQIVLDEIDGRPAAALLVDGVLDDLLIAPSDDRPVPGAIYRAVAQRPMKGQGGLTVDLGHATGFLRQIKGIAPGERFLVQVTGHAEAGKAVPVTPKILFKSRYAIVTPGAPGINVSRSIHDEERRVELRSLATDVADLPEGAGLILRSAAETADDDEIADDIAAMQDIAAKVMGSPDDGAELLLDGPDPHAISWRDWDADSVLAEPGAFERTGVAEWIDRLTSPEVRLSGGASAFIEPTRALVAVDVNTGGDTSQSAGMKANLALVRALPAQLRCRGLGGQIVIDLAPMPKKERRNLENALRAAFRACPVETVPLGWTPLGHFELQRKRERLPLSETLTEPR